MGDICFVATRMCVAKSMEPQGKNYNPAGALFMDETNFDRNYVPQHLAERIGNWKNLSASERFNLTCELSEAAWAKIGVVRDQSKPMDKTIRRVSRS